MCPRCTANQIHPIRLYFACNASIVINRRQAGQEQIGRVGADSLGRHSSPPLSPLSYWADLTHCLKLLHNLRCSTTSRSTAAVTSCYSSRNCRSRDTARPELERHPHPIPPAPNTGLRNADSPPSAADVSGHHWRPNRLPNWTPHRRLLSLTVDKSLCHGPADINDTSNSCPSSATRLSADLPRQSADLSRLSADLSSELSRLSADLSRQSADMSRQSADLSRLSADLSRLSSDLSRLSSDLSRLSVGSVMPKPAPHESGADTGQTSDAAASTHYLAQSIS